MANTTASDLIDYRNELIAGGFDEESATWMARDAAARIVQANGLITRPTDTR